MAALTFSELVSTVLGIVVDDEISNLIGLKGLTNSRLLTIYIELSLVGNDDDPT
jgi:hypothetical protein